MCWTIKFCKINNKKDLDNIEEEIGSNFPDFEEKYKEAIKDKYSFLFVDNREMRLFERFEELLWKK